MRKSYERQILDHNIEKFNVIIKNDIDIFLSTKILTQANKNAVLQVNSMSDAKKIREDLKSILRKMKAVA